jgi:hypothetical protein
MRPLVVVEPEPTCQNLVKDNLTTGPETGVYYTLWPVSWKSKSEYQTQAVDKISIKPGLKFVLSLWNSFDDPWSLAGSSTIAHDEDLAMRSHNITRILIMPGLKRRDR